MHSQWSKAGIVVSLVVMCSLLLSSFASTVQAAVSGRNLPANGQIRLFMGQDSDTLSDYKQAVLNAGLGAPQPGGVTLYTNIVVGGSPAPLAGLYGPVNYGTGTMDFQRTLNDFPGSALAVGLYLSDSSTGCGNQPLRAIIGRNDSDVTSGNPNLITQYRQKVDELVNWLKNSGRQVFLRIGYEFDGPWNCYSTDFYIQAFQYIKGRIDALGASNVATVWQSAAWPRNASPDHPDYNYMVTDPNHYNAWYPGDAYVDWVALSDFYTPGSIATQWGCSTTDVSPTTLQNEVLNFARSHSKPVMIAESAPQGYATGNLTKSCIMNKAPQSTSASNIWDEWYSSYFAFINNNSDVIRAAAYINTNWDSQSIWACNGQVGQTGCSNGYWGDSRVQANSLILNNFINEINRGVYVNGTGAGGNPTPTPTPTPVTNPTPTPTPTPVSSGNRNAYSQIEAESFDSQSGIQIVNSSTASGGARVGYTNNGDWVSFNGVNFGSSSPQQVTFRYSSGRSTSQSFVLEFHLDSPTGPLLAAPGLLGTGNWDSYNQITFNVSNPPTGTHTVVAVFTANDADAICDLDWFRFL